MWPAVLGQVEDIAPGVGRTDLRRTQIIWAQPSPLTQRGWEPHSLLICFDCMGHSWIPKGKMAADGGGGNLYSLSFIGSKCHDVFYIHYCWT